MLAGGNHDQRSRKARPTASGGATASADGPRFDRRHRFADAEERPHLHEPPRDERGDVPIDIVYRAAAYGEGESGATPVVVTRNRESDGLGLALPSGEVAFFQDHGGRRILIGQGRTRDLAVGEDVEIELRESIDVRTSLVMEAEDERSAAYRLTVTNAKDRPVQFEAKLPGTANRISRPSARLSTRDGSALWTVTVPANGSATLSYRIKTGL